MGCNFAVNFDGDVELAECLERLVQVNLAAVDGVALGLERVRDVRGGDGAEEVVVVAGLALEGEGDGIELGAELFRAGFLTGGAAEGGGSSSAR